MEFKRTLKTIIADFKTGNTASFEELYHLFLPAIFAFVSHRTVTREVAKDVTQDSFIEEEGTVTDYDNATNASSTGAIITFSAKADVFTDITVV